MLRTRRLHLLIALALSSLGAPAAAEVPELEGHITDPQHRLSDLDRKALTDKLDKLQQETHIDIATWISNVSPDEALARGTEFYKTRNIGVEWDNGVFFLFPATGPVRIILDRARPELTPDEEARVAAADNPSADLARRLESLATATGDTVRPKVNHARPPGATDREHGLRYAVAALLVFIAALARSLRRRTNPSATDALST